MDRLHREEKGERLHWFKRDITGMPLPEKFTNPFRYTPHPLAKMADAVLISIAEEMTYRSESFASRLTQLAIIDSLFVNVMYKNEQAAKQSLKKINYAVSKTKLK